jgi:hypothetical protein
MHNVQSGFRVNLLKMVSFLDRRCRAVHSDSNTQQATGQGETKMTTGAITF